MWYLGTLTVAVAPRLPLGDVEVLSQASRATLDALDAGHHRLALTLPRHHIDAVARRLVDDLAVRAPPPRVRVFFDSLAAADAWRTRCGACPCEVLGVGDVQSTDDAILVVEPRNRGRPPEDVADGYGLSAVQGLLARARDRPFIMLNADMEALVLSPSIGRPVRPMFYRDFVQTYFLARGPGRSPGDLCAVRRQWPGEWEVWIRHGVLGPSRNAIELSRKTTGRPNAADILELPLLDSSPVPPPDARIDW